MLQVQVSAKEGTHLTHLSRVDYSILNNLASLFHILVCVVFLCPIYGKIGLNGLNTGADPGFLERGFIWGSLC